MEADKNKKINRLMSDWDNEATFECEPSEPTAGYSQPQIEGDEETNNANNAVSELDQILQQHEAVVQRRK